MNLNKVLAMTAIALGLTACGVVKDAKNADGMQKEGNAIATSVNKEKSDLMSEGVYVDLPSSHSWQDWKNKTPEKRAEIRKRLEKMVLQLYRYIEIAKHRDMKLVGGTWKAESVQEGAMKYINSLDKFDGKPQTYKQAAI